jgi:tetratricopeptide (TPR) repeat protein
MSEAKIEYRRALDADPEFTPAAEGLAWVSFGLGEDGFEDSDKAFPEARRAAQSVLKKDPNSAKAHVILSRVALEYDWDWAEAEREAKAALGIEPNNPYALVALALVEGAEGRFAEAAQEADAAVATDPLFAVGHMVRSWAYVRAGRLTDAEEAGRRVLEIAPTYAWAHYYLAQTLMVEGKLDDALAEAQRETVPMGRDTLIVVVFAALGRVKEAEATLTQLRSDEFWSMGQAYALIALNRNDEAFRLMDKAYETKDSDLYGMKGNPLLAKVEGDPRYKALLRKMRLPD